MTHTHTHTHAHARAQVRVAFKQYIDAIVYRVNTRTGVAYNDDPAVMSWCARVWA